MTLEMKMLETSKWTLFLQEGLEISKWAQIIFQGTFSMGSERLLVSCEYSTFDSIQTFQQYKWKLHVQLNQVHFQRKSWRLWFTTSNSSLSVSSASATPSQSSSTSGSSNNFQTHVSSLLFSCWMIYAISA